MKKHQPNVFSKEIWKEIYFLLRRGDFECICRGAAVDGLDPLTVETTKRGVEIFGTVWFLNDGRKNPNYGLHLCLVRPRFSSLNSVSIERLRKAAISDASLVDRMLELVVE